MKLFSIIAFLLIVIMVTVLLLFGAQKQQQNTINAPFIAEDSTCVKECPYIRTSQKGAIRISTR